MNVANREVFEIGLSPLSSNIHSDHIAHDSGGRIFSTFPHLENVENICLT